jgi:hypothetical protein
MEILLFCCSAFCGLFSEIFQREEIIFVFVYSHKKKRKYNAVTSLQERRQEKNMVNWL